MYIIVVCYWLHFYSFLDQGRQSSPTLHVRCHQVKVRCVLFMFMHCVVGFNGGRAAYGSICGVAYSSGSYDAKCKELDFKQSKGVRGREGGEERERERERERGGHSRGFPTKCPNFYDVMATSTTTGLLRSPMMWMYLERVLSRGSGHFLVGFQQTFLGVPLPLLGSSLNPTHLLLGTLRSLKMYVLFMRLWVWSEIWNFHGYCPVLFD